MDNMLFGTLKEIKYLNTENTWRYRPILRYFYEQHGIRTQIRAEEILYYLSSLDAFTSYALKKLGREYTLQDLKLDLGALEGWKNIISRQEMSDYQTIEEFKANRYRYQATRYTIEIERFLQVLEESNEEEFGGGSLDKNLFHRIAEMILQLVEETENTPSDQLNQSWEDLFEYFNRLDRRTSDYLSHISSFQAEEEMMSDSFFSRKQEFITYLRDFVLELQYRLPLLQHLILERMTTEHKEHIIKRIVEHHRSIFRFGKQLSVEKTKKRLEREWLSLERWFCSNEGEISEARNIEIQTVEIIRKILRFASRITESQQTLRSRKQEYVEIAKWFQTIETKEEAHKLSALLFGSPTTRHFSMDADESVEKDRSLWERKEEKITFISRKAGFRTKGKTGSVSDNRKRQKELIRQYLQDQEEIKNRFVSLIIDGRIDLANIPLIDAPIRGRLLSLIEQCLRTDTKKGRTEWGHVFMWEEKEGPVELLCLDGKMAVPNGVFILEQKEKKNEAG